MTTASDLRAEAAKMREFTRWVTDPEVLGEIRLMIAELERRARKLDDGDAGPLGRPYHSRSHRRPEHRQHHAGHLLGKVKALCRRPRRTPPL